MSTPLPNIASNPRKAGIGAAQSTYFRSEWLDDYAPMDCGEPHAADKDLRTSEMKW